MDKAKLIDGPIGETFFRLTIPMVGGICAMITIFLADTYFISRLGTEALAAVSFTFPVTMMLVYFVMGIGIGTASVVSRAIGASDPVRVRRIVTDGLALAVLIVGISSYLGIVTIDPLFKALGAKGEVLVLIRDYMQIWYIGIAFFIIPMVANNIIRATGDAKFPGIFMMVSAVLNLILDPILIFGYFGVPALGIKGAAIATLISFAITMIAALSIIAFRDKLLSLEIPPLREVLNSWSQILYIGLPAAATNITIHFAFAVVIKLLASYGDEAVAAFGVATRVETFAFAVFFALSSIIGPFVGQNWGAQKFHRVAEGMHLSFRFCFIWGLFLAVFLALFAKPLVGIFDQNKIVVTVATLYLMIVPLSYGAEGVIMMTTSSFNALGKPIPSLVISLARMFVFYLPLAYMGKMFFGIAGIFGAAFVANWIMGLVALLWNQEHRRKEILILAGT